LDTNAVSALADGRSDIREAIQHESVLAMPVVVLGEFLFGIRQSRYRSQYEAWLREFRSLYAILPAGTETASHYADIRAELNAGGRPIPTNDIWIAALAREYSYALVTRDKHFQAVQRLQIVSW
jgi:predicted nucleic acid-binding protein